MGTSTPDGTSRQGCDRRLLRSPSPRSPPPPAVRTSPNRDHKGPDRTDQGACARRTLARPLCRAGVAQPRVPQPVLQRVAPAVPQSRPDVLHAGGLPRSRSMRGEREADLTGAR